MSLAENRTTSNFLTAMLVVAPAVYLAADGTYAARGWEDPIAGCLHILGAILYGYLVARIATWLPARSRLLLPILITGVLGCVGNVAYGFETIHMSLGDVQLVHRPGAANIIKPLGLFFPISIALVAGAVGQLGHRWQGWLIFAASLAWPVAHIGNIAPLAIAVNVALLVGFGSLVAPRAVVVHQVETPTQTPV